MYQIMYKAYGNDEYQCLGGSTDTELTLEEMDKLEAGPLGGKGEFMMVRSGNKQDKSCKECVAACTGTGKEGNANQCSYYKPLGKEKNAMKRNVRILEITCCGECPNYNSNKDQCIIGAEVEGENFFEDCPLEEK